jgi:hypothetical protein
MSILFFALVLSVLACALWSSRQLRHSALARASVWALAIFGLLICLSLAILSSPGGSGLPPSGVVANTLTTLFAILAPVSACHLSGQVILRRGLSPIHAFVVGAVFGTLALSAAIPVGLVFTCAFSGDCV